MPENQDSYQPDFFPPPTEEHAEADVKRSETIFDRLKRKYGQQSETPPLQEDRYKLTDAEREEIKRLKENIVKTDDPLNPAVVDKIKELAEPVKERTHDQGSSVTSAEEDLLLILARGGSAVLDSLPTSTRQSIRLGGDPDPEIQQLAEDMDNSIIRGNTINAIRGYYEYQEMIGEEGLSPELKQRMDNINALSTAERTQLAMELRVKAAQTLIEKGVLDLDEVGDHTITQDTIVSHPIPTVEELEHELIEHDIPLRLHASNEPDNLVIREPGADDRTDARESVLKRYTSHMAAQTEEAVEDDDSEYHVFRESDSLPQQYLRETAIGEPDRTIEPVAETEQEQSARVQLVNMIAERGDNYWVRQYLINTIKTSGTVTTRHVLDIKLQGGVFGSEKNKTEAEVLEKYFINLNEEQAREVLEAHQSRMEQSTEIIWNKVEGAQIAYEAGIRVGIEEGLYTPEQLEKAKRDVAIDVVDPLFSPKEEVEYIFGTGVTAYVIPSTEEGEIPIIRMSPYLDQQADRIPRLYRHERSHLDFDVTQINEETGEWRLGFNSAYNEHEAKVYALALINEGRAELNAINIGLLATGRDPLATEAEILEFTTKEGYTGAYYYGLRMVASLVEEIPLTKLNEASSSEDLAGLNAGIEAIDVALTTKTGKNLAETNTEVMQIPGIVQHFAGEDAAVEAVSQEEVSMREIQNEAPAPRAETEIVDDKEPPSPEAIQRKSEELFNTKGYKLIELYGEAGRALAYGEITSDELAEKILRGEVKEQTPTPREVIRRALKDPSLKEELGEETILEASQRIAAELKANPDIAEGLSPSELKAAIQDVVRGKAANLEQARAAQLSPPPVETPPAEALQPEPPAPIENKTVTPPAPEPSASDQLLSEMLSTPIASPAPTEHIDQPAPSAPPQPEVKPVTTETIRLDTDTSTQAEAPADPYAETRARVAGMLNLIESATTERELRTARSNVEKQLKQLLKQTTNPREARVIKAQLDEFGRSRPDSQAERQWLNGRISLIYHQAEGQIDEAAERAAAIQSKVAKGMSPREAARRYEDQKNIESPSGTVTEVGMELTPQIRETAQAIIDQLSPDERAAVLANSEAQDRLWMQAKAILDDRHRMETDDTYREQREAQLAAAQAANKRDNNPWQQLARGAARNVMSFVNGVYEGAKGIPLTEAEKAAIEQDKQERAAQRLREQQEMYEHNEQMAKEKERRAWQYYEEMEEIERMREAMRAAQRRRMEALAQQTNIDTAPDTDAYTPQTAETPANFDEQLPLTETQSNQTRNTRPEDGREPYTLYGDDLYYPPETPTTFVPETAPPSTGATTRLPESQVLTPRISTSTEEWYEDEYDTTLDLPTRAAPTLEERREHAWNDQNFLDKYRSLKTTLISSLDTMRSDIDPTGEEFTNAVKLFEYADQKITELNQEYGLTATN